MHWLAGSLGRRPPLIYYLHSGIIYRSQSLRKRLFAGPPCGCGARTSRRCGNTPNFGYDHEICCRLLGRQLFGHSTPINAGSLQRPRYGRSSRYVEGDETDETRFRHPSNGIVRGKGRVQAGARRRLRFPCLCVRPVCRRPVKPTHELCHEFGARYAEQLQATTPAGIKQPAEQRPARPRTKERLIPWHVG